MPISYYIKVSFSGRRAQGVAVAVARTHPGDKCCEETLLVALLGCAKIVDYVIP